MKITDMILPLLISFIILYAYLKKVNVYESFIDGTKESFSFIIKMFPSILSMVFAVNIFIKSNILESLFTLLNPILSKINVPVEILPMAIIRPISGSSSLAILNNIFEKFTPDSYIGKIASVIQGSTDTTFYVLTLYFGTIGIKKIKYSLWAGLIADLFGIISSIIVVNVLFY